MGPTDEALLHAFYGGDDAAFDRLVERRNLLLDEFAFLILGARTGSAIQALSEWDIDERLAHV